MSKSSSSVADSTNQWRVVINVHEIPRWIYNNKISTEQKYWNCLGISTKKLKSYKKRTTAIEANNKSKNDYKKIINV